jgi:hypothetical protein
MRTDKRFRRTRENWAEFSEAAKSASLIRKAFADFTDFYRDPKGHPRLLRETLKVVKSDPTSERGKRQLTLGDLNIIKGYDFNIRKPLFTSFKQPYAVSIDRTAGTATFDIAEFNADYSVSEPYGASNFKFVACVAVINWEERTYEKMLIESSLWETGEALIPAQNLALSFTPDTPHTIVVSFGTWFYQEVNGQVYIMRDGSAHAMAIVEVDHI